jgi:hypothetical protein
VTSFEARSGLYELLLRFPDGVEELRLTDQLESFCGEDGLLVFRDQRWAIVGTRRASVPQAVAGLICQQFDPATSAPIKHDRTPDRRSPRVFQPV